MMKLKPNCECCDTNLPPEATNARICTFECTFCSECAENRFNGICPNCNGELVQRPVRTKAMLDKFPASTERFVKAHPECVDIAS